MNEEHDEYNGSGMEWPLLARYFAGGASSEEREAIERRARSEPEWNEELARLRMLWELGGAIPPSTRIDSMWETVARGMQPLDDPARSPGAQGVTHPPSAARRRSGAWRVIGAIAACLVLIAAASTLLLLGHRASGRSDMAAVVGPLQEYRTERGQSMRVLLADGTDVALGPESRIQIHPFGADGVRMIDLEGEAVFNVAHDKRRPFQVHSAHAVTEVLGTVFSVRAKPHERDVEVVVAEGLVALRSAEAPPGSGTMLHAGQLGRLDPSGRTEVHSDIDENAYLAWTRGRITFRRVPLGEVVAHLSHWYGYPVHIPNDSIAGERITVDMPIRPLPDVLDAITVPLDLRHERADGTIVIHP